MMIVGLLLFISIYNIIIYIFRKDDIFPLIFGIFSLLWTINIFNIQSTIIYNFFSNQPYRAGDSETLSVGIVNFCTVYVEGESYPRETVDSGTAVVSDSYLFFAWGIQGGFAPFNRFFFLM